MLDISLSRKRSISAGILLFYMQDVAFLLQTLNFSFGELPIANERVNIGGVSTVLNSKSLWLASMPELWLRWAKGHSESVLMRILELGFTEKAEPVDDGFEVYSCLVGVDGIKLRGSSAVDRIVFS